MLESLARQETLRALLAFSTLHNQVRTRKLAAEHGFERNSESGSERSNGDLFETERFMLDEVLQLICDKLLSITNADGIVIALAEGQEFVCRACVGVLSLDRQRRLRSEFEFLQDCLETGRILRCDDCQIDLRVEFDIACQLGARSTVLVPLRGRGKPLGVLQAFSKSPRAFSDNDIRSFDLFAELILSALKPEDEDRRILWLSDVAEEVLQPSAAVSDQALEHQPSVTESVVEAGLAPSQPVPQQLDSPSAAFADVESLSQPGMFPALAVELPEAVEAGAAKIDCTTENSITVAATDPDEPESSFTFLQSAYPARAPRKKLLLPGFFATPHPGLSVVMGLVAVAALFSAGAWWGITRGNLAILKPVGATSSAATPSSHREAKSPETPPNAVSDNLMNPPNLDSKTSVAAPLTAVAADKMAALPKIMGVRHWSSSTASTVVIDMEDQVPYEVHRLMSPERIYFDLHDTVLPAELEGKTMDVGDPSLTRVRIGQPVAGVTRIVLDTRDGSNFSVSMESSPYRLVVELRGSDRNLSADKSPSSQLAAMPPATRQAAPTQAGLGHPSSVNLPPQAAKPAPVAAFAANVSDQPLPARTGKFRIVLDAGHGGWDLGTVGRQGLLEKDLVLDVTRRLGKLLQTRMGSEVMFTRTDDTYLPLEQRADIANRTQSDLFVSIHANYSTSAAARGVETYFSDMFSAPGAREGERREDGSVANLTPVALSVGGLHEKIEESRKLAASVQRALYSTLAASSPGIRDRGIKDSAFVVLTGTTMPSILTEISFVSSPADERNLQSAAYRQQIAEALYQGIARYQQTSAHGKIAQLQKPLARQ